MNKKEKEAVTSKILIETQDKGNGISLKSKVLSALKHERLTAIAINARYRFNDARKIISSLRQSGYPIVDFRLPDGRKVYWCNQDGQLMIDFEGGAQ